MSALQLWSNLLKISSRSSSSVTGFNLHMKRTFSGGLSSALLISPIISSTTALLFASFLASSSSFSSSPFNSSSPSNSSPALILISTFSSSGLSIPSLSTLNSSKPSNPPIPPTKGSSKTSHHSTLTSVQGLPSPSVYIPLILSSTPHSSSTTCPKTVQSSKSWYSWIPQPSPPHVVIVNWLPQVMPSPPIFVTRHNPLTILFPMSILGVNSSEMKREDGPFFTPQMLEPPVPVPVGSPVWRKRFCITLKIKCLS
mmetsp:Transcript_4940/g.9883  ORF Transcript_4940/g.9883 Transcript_4940/m.9883 type:complete len:255 (-) Transcript_4940:167-931(-)